MNTRSPNHYQKKGDTYRPLEVKLQDDAGRPVNLSGATGVTFRMKLVSGETLKVSGAGAISDATQGIVRYQWQAADVDTPGDYNAEFEVDWSGAKDTYPRGNQQFLLIRIQGDLG